jgi:lipid-binding SYLF domain-containing protein
MSTPPVQPRRTLPTAADASSRPERMRQVITHSLKAAGLTAGGVVAGAVLESRRQLSRKLPISQRPSRKQAIRTAIAKRLP